MPSLPFSILFLIIILLMGTTTTRAEYCESGLTPCKGEDIGPYITFPFQLREFGNESDRCGYPGFELFCNKYGNQTLINLPNAGDFVVTGIDPSDQTVDVKDPDDCLPKRLLQPGSIDFTNSPFEWSVSLFYDLVNLTFLNCSSKDGKKSVPHPGQIVPCLSTPNYSVVYIQSSLLPIPAMHNSCRVIFPALVHRKDVKLASIVGPSNLFPYMKFQWKFPDCKHCYHCGFLRDSGDEVTCIDGKENIGDGDWMKTKLIGITLTVGVSGLIILVAYMLSGNRSEATGTEHSGSRTNNVPEVSGVALRGLHSSSIENYPTTEVGENGELPNPNDSICSICLSEYQAKETLRTLPDCNHYFHAGCIHGWLKINLTCPLCRN